MSIDKKVDLKTEDIINQGKRNDYLFRIGCFLQRKDLGDGAILRCLEKENELRYVPQLDKKVLQGCNELGAF